MILSKFATWAFSPMTTAPLLIALMLTHSPHIDKKTVYWFAGLVSSAMIPMVTYTIYLVKTGYLPDFFMQDQSKRLKPIIIFIKILIVMSLIFNLLKAPLTVNFILLCSIAVMVVMGGITIFTKISFHSSFAMTYTTLLALTHENYYLLSIAIVMTAWTSWSRLHLKKHTLHEILTGCAVGALTGVIIYTLELSIIFNKGWVQWL